SIGNSPGATSISVSGAADLGDDVETTGTQTYSGAVTISADGITLTTADSQITFSSTVNSEASEANALNIDVGTSEVEFDGVIGGGTNGSLGAIAITGDLDLDAELASATSINVSLVSDLAANVTTSSTQTYQGAVTVSTDVTLTTTNSNVDFDSTVDAGTLGDALTIAAGTGDVTFDDAIGGTTALGNITITTGALTAAAIDLDGTLSITNSSASSITGVIDDGDVSAALTKAGSGTLTLSATNTYIGATTINAGTLKVTTNGALGTTDGITTIASGATLDLANVTYSTTEAITNNGGTLSTSTGTSVYAGTMTLGANSTIDVDGTQLTISTGIGDSSSGYSITKDGNGTLVLYNASTYSGDTIISDGTLIVTGTLADTTDVTVASGATYDVDQTDTIQSLAGAGTINIASAKTLTFGDANAKTISGVIEGAGSIVKQGAGTQTLSGTNTFTGTTNINAGVLYITNGSALGTTAGTTTVASGAALYLGNGITVAEAITISGTGISSGGAIQNYVGTNTLTGLITLAADSEIQINTGTTLTMNVTSGNAITGTYNLTIESVGTSSIADPIATSTGNLTKTGAGTLTLSGTNTFSGDLTISAGTVTMTGTLADTVDVSISSGATYDVDTTDTIQSISGAGTVSLGNDFNAVTLTVDHSDNHTFSGSLVIPLS
ncbi:MAG: hypothetical protein EBW40_10360, partial [Gammaproteobacteria bacterium]|nr:hypothetical protein [Gammaproteobacteria bacterium]